MHQAQGNERAGTFDAAWGFPHLCYRRSARWWHPRTVIVITPESPSESRTCPPCRPPSADRRILRSRPALPKEGCLAQPPAPDQL